MYACLTMCDIFQYTIMQSIPLSLVVAATTNPTKISSATIQSQWWMYRLRQQQQKLLQQQDSFLKQIQKSKNNTNQTIITSVVQIVETEYMDEYTGQWVSIPNGTYCLPKMSKSDDKRYDIQDPITKIVPQWTDAMTGRPVPSPSEYTLHPNQTWIGEWKIAVTTISQSGWEYSRRKKLPSSFLLGSSYNTTQGRRYQRRSSPLLQYTHRQRIWLRTLATNTSITTTTLRKPSGRKRKSKKHQSFLGRITENIQNDWNFKGFGITLVKSAVFRNAFGIAFRLPITWNFDFWDRHPILPALSSSIAIFLPQLCICLFLNLSLRIEYIQLALYYIAHIIPAIFTTILLAILRGLALAVSALLFPLTRKPLLLATISEQDNIQLNYVKGTNERWWALLPNQYHRPVRRYLQSDERIDVSWSFRWSLDRGYEFRTTCSHWYTIPIATLVEAMVPLLPLSSDKLTIYATTSIMKTMDWIPRHAAAVGWSFTGPVLQDRNGLFVTGSMLLSLSGLYFTEQPNRNRVGWKIKMNPIAIPVDKKNDNLLPQPPNHIRVVDKSKKIHRNRNDDETDVSSRAMNITTVTTSGINKATNTKVASS
jgi:hypothetical protein